MLKLATFLETRINTKKIHHVLEFYQSQWLKPYIEFNTQKRIEAEKNNVKDGKALNTLMIITINGKTMENLRHRINVKLINNKKHLKMYIKTKLYVTQNIWQ